jgi:hypothetical protein
MSITYDMMERFNKVSKWCYNSTKKSWFPRTLIHNIRLNVDSIDFIVEGLNFRTFYSLHSKYVHCTRFNNLHYSNPSKVCIRQYRFKQNRRRTDMNAF